MGMNRKTDTNMPKQKLYKTAFVTALEVYISLQNAEQNDDGTWTYTGSSHYKEGAKFIGRVFHESELEMLCL